METAAAGVDRTADLAGIIIDMRGFDFKAAVLEVDAAPRFRDISADVTGSDFKTGVCEVDAPPLFPNCCHLRLYGYQL